MELPKAFCKTQYEFLKIQDVIIITQYIGISTSHDQITLVSKICACV